MAAAIEVQGCSRCDKPAILHQEYSGQHFCAYHLGQSIRKRVSKDLRGQLVLPKNARHEDGRPFTILACISGGKDSAVLLEMLVDIIGKRRDVHIVAGCVDEGIDGYRAPSMECARELAESLEVEFVTLSYEEMGYQRMDEVVRRMPVISEQYDEAKGMMPCSYCGVFRRQSLNALSEKVNADVMALGHDLALLQIHQNRLSHIVEVVP